MKPRNRVLMSLAATGLVALGGNVAGTERNHHFASKRGLVHQVDFAARTFVICKHNGKPTGTFVWNESSRFFEEGKAVSPEHLRPGDRALVRYQSQNGQQIAAQIVLHASPAPATARADS